MRTAAAAMAVVALAACGPSSGGEAEAPAQATPTASTPSQSTLSGEITVFAAASLTDAFESIAESFEADNPGTTVTFSFGPSSGLATQITEGAPADVFASASTTTMDDVVASGAGAEPATFAENVLAIAVPADNPAGITTIADLAKPDVKVALCQADVPCGTLAAKVLDKAGVKVTPVTEEVDVKATLAKVELGEVDAGLVYVTDVQAAGDKVRGIDIPADVNAATTYPIAVLTEAPNQPLAEAFVDEVLSDAGSRVLTEAGFKTP